MENNFVFMLKESIDRVLCLAEVVNRTSSVSDAVDMLNATGVPTLSGDGLWTYDRVTQAKSRYLKRMTGEQLEALENAHAALSWV